MASWRELAFATGVGLEALAAAAIIHRVGALALAAHLASCSAIALGAGAMPGGAAARRLAFATVLFLPVFGVLGWLAAALVRPAAAQPRFARVRIPFPGPDAAHVRAGRLLAPPGGWPASARLIAARDSDDPDAIAQLRRNLAAPDEDVRLLAHAVLESKNRIAYRRIHDGASELERAPVERVAMIHRRLAAQHWEMARTGLADGECLVDALERARHHARAALAEDPGHASSWLLLGRIELRCGRAEDAEAALAHAVDRGIAPAVVEPYLVEAAFLARRFDRVRELLAAERLAAELRQTGADPAGGIAALDRVRRFWT